MKNRRPAIAIQHVRHRWGKEQYSLHIFNANVLKQEFMQSGFLVKFKCDEDESCKIPGLSEVVKYNTYLLELKQ